MTYDGFDRLIRLNFPVTGRGVGAASASDYEAYSYDANGNRLSLRKRDGAVINYAYDALNRMATKSGAQIAAVNYGYDLLGRPTLTKFTSGGSGVAYAYDAAGRQVSETGNLGLKVTYAYDKAGNRTGITWPDAVAVAYTYDAAGKMTSVAKSGTPAFLTYAYDNLGRRVSGSYGTASVTSYGYDAGDRLTQLGHDLPGTTGDVAYGFSFNPAGQLSGQSVSNPAYVWTPVARSLTATADGLNRDSAIAVAGGYDANQNLTNDGSRQFGYDGENRLTGTGGGGTTPLALVYDPLGRLQQTTAGTGPSAVVTRFIYDGDRLIAELGASGTTVLRRYVHGAGVDEPVLWWEGSGTADGRSLLADRQGSIVANAPLAGGTSAVSLYTYGPYGERTSWGGSRFAYTGQIALPEASLYHYKARAYDPSRGWFLQTDPVGYEAGDFNLYAYVGGDPVNKSDPSGRAPGDKYRSIDAAGINAVRDVAAKSVTENREYAGTIYANSDQTFSYTPPLAGDEHESQGGSPPRGSKMVGDYHTHGAADPDHFNEDFSKTDINGNNQFGTVGYLGTPSGDIKKYDPVTQAISTIAQWIKKPDTDKSKGDLTQPKNGAGASDSDKSGSDPEKRRSGTNYREPFPGSRCMILGCLGGL